MAASNQWYIAFASSARLFELDSRFIQNMKAGVKESQAPLVMEVLSLFIDEVLDVFFVAPMNFVGLKEFQRKIVLGAVSTIKKATHFALGKIVKSLSNEDLRAIAQYMDVMLQIEPEGSNPPAYICFPIDVVLEQRLHSVFARARAEDAKKEVPELTSALLALTEAALTAYILQPLELLKLGYVMKKLAMGSYEIVRTASHVLVKKLFETMDESELKRISEYLDQLIRQGPEHI